MKSTKDNLASPDCSITIDPITNLVRIDGIIAFRLIVHSNTVFLQFADSDRMRSAQRGTRYVEIPLSTLVATIKDFY